MIGVSNRIRRHLVFGANTDVGKTVVTAGLVRAGAAHNTTKYVKPLQTGGEDMMDVNFVKNVMARCNFEDVKYDTFFQWDIPASPHLASRVENLPISDDQIVESFQKSLMCDSLDSSVFIETAGGALSPASASPENIHFHHANGGDNSTSSWGWSTQADLYKSFSSILPVVLIGDGRLGGIASTLSTMESLIIRGYKIHSIILIDDGNRTESNAVAVREYLSRQCCPMRAGDGTAMFGDVEQDVISLPGLPPMPRPLDEWFDEPSVQESFQSIHTRLNELWELDFERLSNMRSTGRECVWWPFTQHESIKDDEEITLISGASGDNYHVLSNGKEDSSNNLQYKKLFDGCASWWTQGVGHGETTIALATAAAAGRYGHVIFPDAAHNPAVSLAEFLVSRDGPGSGWASRTFFSDDGSTAIEVGIKMAMKKYAKDHFGSLSESDKNPFGPAGTSLTVLAQEDCYHGDTLGCMDVAVPSVFNEGQHPWYSAKGLFLETPTLAFIDGVLEVINPSENCQCKPEDKQIFESISDAMDVNNRLNSSLYTHYKDQIALEWDAYEKESGTIDNTKQVIGCVIIEPILMGAGGMKFVDPLWQRALMDVARNRKVPILFDEIASGLYRVGVMSCKDILKATPDIACYAKLLTGGIVPLSVTLATDDVFESFLGETKSQALLHGHSYTAHPMGCLAALQALNSYKNSDVIDRIYFDEFEVRQLSMNSLVSESFALGTVLAIKLKGETGYAASLTSKPIIEKLRQNGIYARPLGNVVYIMVSPFTSTEKCAHLIKTLSASLH